MIITEVDETQHFENRKAIVAESKRNAESVGEKNNCGAIVVTVEDNGAKVIVGTKSIEHGLERNYNSQGPVLARIGEILKRSIAINEAYPQKSETSGTFIYIGFAQNTVGDRYVVRMIVDRFTNVLKDADVLYAVKNKKEPAAPKAPGISTSPTDSMISISHLLEIVNNKYPEILSADVLMHFDCDTRPTGTPADLADRIKFYFEYLGG